MKSDLGRQRDSKQPQLGLVQWFTLGDFDSVDSVLEDLKRLGVTSLRTGISWAEYVRPGGEEWHKEVLERLGREVELIPCFVYTPPSEAVVPSAVACPKDLKKYADFIDHVITSSGRHFDFVELWNEPNNPSEWDTAVDPGWHKFCEMVGGAAHWARKRGKKTILGGLNPVDPNWLQLMFDRGLMKHIDVVGVHGFPGVWDGGWEGWPAMVGKVREVLGKNGSEAEIWITKTGYSTWRHDEFCQLQRFVEVLDAPAERIYWADVEDLHRGHDYADEKSYHFGLKRADGSKKLLLRIWDEGGLAAVKDAASYGVTPSIKSKPRPTLITGGAGFIGTNLADRLLSDGKPVIVLDSLARSGVERNLQWLRDKHGKDLEVCIADVRERGVLRDAVSRAGQVFHFAAQVAVTTSLYDPIDDFDRNARGTLNLLEEIRRLDSPPPLVFTSTNKVYGGLEDVPLKLYNSRYEPEDQFLRTRGIGEDRPLDFHSPYGCSKGTADQYVIDYSRTFGLKAVVFRMSCIYGLHQFGTEDQGWVAHFLIQALKKQPITIYGDGRQVRDILFAEDLVNAFLLAEQNMSKISGQAFNIGGGPSNTISLLELLEIIRFLEMKGPAVTFSDWRPGDQRYYVSDSSKFKAATGWRVEVDASEGVERLYRWLKQGSAGDASHASEASKKVEATAR